MKASQSTIDLIQNNPYLSYFEGDLLFLVGHNEFFTEIGNIDKKIASLSKLPHLGGELELAINKARREGKFRYDDIHRNIVKNYVGELKDYIDKAVPIILKEIGRTDLLEAVRKYGFERVKYHDKGFFESLGDFAADIGKGVAYVVAAPLNSITGHTYNPGFKTAAGGLLSGLTVQGTDSVHVAGKTFADTISSGYATKLANVVRSEENKERPGAYNESQIKNTGILGDFEVYSKSGAAIIGNAIGKKALASADNPLKGINQLLPPAFGPEEQPEYTEEEGWETVYDVPYKEETTDMSEDDKKRALIIVVILAIIIIAII